MAPRSSAVQKTLRYSLAVASTTAALLLTLAIPDVHKARAGGTGTFQGFCPSQNGTPKWWEVIVTPIRDADGKVERLLATSRDITARKQAEQALIQSEKLASVGRMAATIAHEINNPLSAAINALYLVSQEKALSANARQNLRLAEEELARMAQITRTTLGFYRDTSTPTLVRLHDLADNVLSLYARKIRERGIAVHTHYDAVNGKIRATPGEIRQVISNLLANGLDALPPGGALHLRVAALELAQERAVRLTIADNGSGISPAHLKRIFDPFFTTKESVGTGLGLWVSREIVRKYGGAIRVRSRPGKGTVFCLFFPSPAAAEQTMPVRAAG
jgi:signal transduction histidine kinase